MNADTVIYVDRIPSPLGPLQVAWSDRGLHVVDFADERSDERLAKRAPAGRSGNFNRSALAPAFERYFAGDSGALVALPVVMSGTDFQVRVWQALRAIPAGRTSTYGELATRIGHPGASRAVGSANGCNPIAIVVPCHRVIGSGGRLAGYGGGIERKRWLLRHEGATFVDEQAA